MPSTFMGLETARRGLNAHQQAMQVTAHNISNADNKQYARQRVKITSMQPLYDPAFNRELTPGMIGQGSMVDSIERVRDHYIDDRILETTQGQSYWKVQKHYYDKMEGIYNEPSDHALKQNLNEFWDAWQDLSVNPSSYDVRETVKTRAEALVGTIKDTFGKLQNLRGQADAQIQETVNDLNKLAVEVRDLNVLIEKSEALGDKPNDLMDRRDAVIEQLSAIADVSVSRSPNGMIVYIGSEVLVQGNSINKLMTKADPSNEGYLRVLWADKQGEPVFSNGSMYSLFQARDGFIKESIDKMDLLAVNLNDVVNSIHKDGFGLTGETNIEFFKLENLSRNVSANVDINLDGQNDTTAIFKIAGNNSLKKDRPVGISGVLTFVKNDENHTPIQISYREDETLNNIIQRINKSDAGVVAYLDHRGRLVLKGELAADNWQKNFMIRHIEDSGELLTGFAGLLQNSGPGGAFDYRRINDIQKLQSGRENITFTPVLHAAGSISLSDQVKNNVGKIAAGGGRDVGGTGDINTPYGKNDGQNALKIAQAMRHEEVMVGKFKNPQEFYDDLIAKLGSESREAQDKVKSSEIVMNNLLTMRQSVMGVNMDEEMSNMIQFQHGYNASARVLQTMNEMLEYLISRLG